jgi:hypothetical protein
MKKYLFILLGSVFLFQSCKNANDKELGEIDGLIKILDTTEEALHAIDTSDLYSITKLVKEDLKRINKSNDTLTREAAYKVDLYIGRTKTLYSLSNNYTKFQTEIVDLKKQLNNLRQDVSNNLIKKEDYSKYYNSEQKMVLYVKEEVSLATRGMADRIKKMLEERDGFVEMLADPQNYSSKKQE